MGVFLPQRWRHQPQGAVVPHRNLPPGSIIFCGWMNQVFGADFATSVSPRPVTGVGGRGWSASVPDGRILIGRVWRPDWQHYTVVSHFERNKAALTTQPAIYGVYDTHYGNTFAERVGIRRTTEPAGAISWLWRSGADGELRVHTNGGVVNDGSTHTVAFRFESPKIGQIWLDGVSMPVAHGVIGNGYDLTGDNGLSDHDMAIGAANIGGSYQQGGGTHIYFWARIPKTLSNLGEITENPYGTLLEPKRHSFYSFPVGDITPNIPTLSLPGVSNITDTSARPHVTLTY